MVRRLPNGGLTWFQRGNGGKITVMKEEPAYGPAEATEDLQINAEHENFHSEDDYMGKLAIAQVNVDASRQIEAVPVKPLYVTVTDPVMDRGGNVTPGSPAKVAWPAPLPELRPKVVFKSGSPATTEPIVIKS